MKKRRILLLTTLWASALALFALSAAAAHNQRPDTPMTASETSYRSVTPAEKTQSDVPRVITAEGCLSESELCELLTEKLSAVLNNTAVTIGDGCFTLYGDLTSDTDTLLAAYPSFVPYELILRMIGGAPVSATLCMSWSEEEGFTAAAGDVTLANVPIPVGDLADMANEFAAAMDARFAQENCRIALWKLSPGGLNYRATLPDETYLRRLYPAPL